MDNTKMKNALIISGAVAACACIGVGVGCYYGGVAAGELNAPNITSYVSTDSTIYSSTAEVVDAVAKSVVEIRTESVTTSWGQQYIVSGAGSGVIVGHDDGDKYYVITNNHVVSGASNITVTLRSDESGATAASYPATLVAADEAGDIAVVAIEEQHTLNVAQWGNSDTLRIGDDLIAIGNPLGSLGGTVTKGILSAKGRSIAVDDYTMTLLQTDTAINPGNSGGGLFNMRGELIGVVNAKTSDEEVEGICFAIPGNIAKGIFDDLVRYKVVQGRVDFGIKVAVGTTDGATSTVYVTDASSAVGEFKQYDKIASINGRDITTLLSYNDAIASPTPGDEAEIIVYRGSLVSSGFGRYTVQFEKSPTAFAAVARQKSA